MALSPLEAEIEGVRAENSKEKIYKAIKADIVRGVFDMGQRLNEGQMAAKYGVSKTPVREALTLLMQEGLVEVQPRVGYLTSQVTLQDVDDLFDLRKIVEGAAAERAASRIDDETLARLENIHSNGPATDRESFLRLLDENMEFHCTVAAASGNRRLVDAVSRLLEQMQRLVVLRLEPEAGSDDVIEEHRQIVEALRRRDPSLARDIMVCSIDNTHAALLDAVKRRMADWRI